MKLIDILVRELPNRGGWPQEADYAWCDGDGEVRFSDWGQNACPDFYPKSEVDISERSVLVGEGGALKISRNDYEAALAASKVSVWDGEGMPPAGLMVELMDDSQSQTWGEVTIKFFGDSFAVWDDHGEECSNSLCHVHVRPIQTEADRKREEAVAQFNNFVTMGKFTLDEDLAAAVWDAIAAGKIPGIRLTDDAGSQ